MSDKLRVFGTQFDPSVVQALIRQDQQRLKSETNRARAAARRRKAQEKRLVRDQTFEQN
jgi:hypothetical protein